MGNEPSWQCVPVSEIQGTCSNGIADCSCLDATALGCPEGTECCSADADHQETITIHLQ